MTFFVTGLPRSRTAWLANFLTYDDQFCYHEGLNGCSSIDEYKDKVKDKGDSNTGLMMFDFKDHFPDSKVIVIDSSVDKSIEFSKSVFGVDLTDIMVKGKTRLDSINGLHININDINDRLKEIWEYVSDKPFDKERADMLIKLNIQVNDPLSMDGEAANKFKESVDGWLT